MARITLPPATRALLVLNLVLSALNATLRFNKWTASLDASPTIIATTPSNYLSDPKWANAFLVLVPSKSLWFPWTFLTACIVENNILSLAISGTVIWFGGKYLERALGGKEFGKFVFGVVFIPNFLTFLVYTIWHSITSPPKFPTPIQGLVAVEAGFLVALKQLVPEHTVSLFKGTIRVRIKHFPAIFALANILSGPILGTDTAFWLSLYGFLTSWIYLRFFRLMEIPSAATGGEMTKMKGDASDTFAFVAFFPDALHPIIAPICNITHDIFVRLRLITPFSADAIEAGNEHAQVRSDGLPNIMTGRGGGRRAEAERRRALALRALDQRLSVAVAAAAAKPASDVAGENTSNEVYTSDNAKHEAA